MVRAKTKRTRRKIRKTLRRRQSGGFLVGNRVQVPGFGEGTVTVVDPDNIHIGVQSLDSLRYVRVPRASTIFIAHAPAVPQPVSPMMLFGLQQGLAGGRRDPRNMSATGRGRITSIDGMDVRDYVISSHGVHIPVLLPTPMGPAPYYPHFTVPENCEIVFYSGQHVRLKCPVITQTQICWQGDEASVVERYIANFECPNYTLVSDATDPDVAPQWSSGVADCHASNTTFLDGGGRAAPIINIDAMYLQTGQHTLLDFITNRILQHHAVTYPGMFARIHCLFCRELHGMPGSNLLSMESKGWAFGQKPDNYRRARAAEKAAADAAQSAAAQAAAAGGEGPAA